MSATARKHSVAYDQAQEPVLPGMAASLGGAAPAGSAAGATRPLRRAELVMPWEAGLAEDRRFRRWAMHAAGVTAMLVLLVSLLPERVVPPVADTDKRQQYARLVIEKQVVPEPVVPEVVPEPKVVEPKVEPKPAKEKPVVEKRVAEKPKPKPATPAPVETVQKPPQPSAAERRAEARQQAANAGLLAMSDQLAALRQTASSSSAASSAAKLQSGAANASSNQRQLIAAKSDTGRGAAAAAVSHQAGGVGLAGRQRAEVAVSEAAVAAVASQVAAASQQQSRSADEIRRVMDANKGGIYSVYNRALRKNPMLQGSFGFSMVIEASGRVSSVSMLNSELADPALEKRLLSRIRMIQFEARDVASTEVNYSFDFLPS